MQTSVIFALAWTVLIQCVNSIYIMLLKAPKSNLW